MPDLPQSPQTPDAAAAAAAACGTVSLCPAEAGSSQPPTCAAVGARRVGRWSPPPCPLVQGEDQSQLRG